MENVVTISAGGEGTIKDKVTVTREELGDTIVGFLDMGYSEFTIVKGGDGTSEG